MVQRSAHGRLYFAGFNGFLNLDRSGIGDDVSILRVDQPSRPGEEISSIGAFTELLFPNEDFEVWATFFSAVILRRHDQLFHYGFRRGDARPTLREIRTDVEIEDIRSTFGGLDGFLGAVTQTGELLFLKDDAEIGNFSLESETNTMQCLQQHCGKEVRVQALAIAGNDEVCVAVTERWTSDTTSVRVFSDLAAMRSGTEPHASHSVPAPVTSLQAGATTFILMLEGHSVWTFGSPLQPALLARSPDKTTPAQAPGLVDALGGIKISKIAVCDWYGAALSEDRDLYVWGGRAGESRGLDFLAETGDDVTLVEVDDGADVADIAVGMGHMLLATVGGKVWACGDNENGQLGLRDSAPDFLSQWTTANLESCENHTISLKAVGWSSWVWVYETHNPS